MTQNQTQPTQPKTGPFTVAFVVPILPGKSEVWRRFVQEIMGSRRTEYAESRQRLGITREWAWLIETGRGDVAIVSIETEQPEPVTAHLATSELPFDRWYREQLLALQGFDLTQPPATAPPELILEWSAFKKSVFNTKRRCMQR
jgi:hypothetical protein